MAAFDFHRPIWTCGRYNAEKHVALMYNLLAGYSYFFKSYSADVIGQMLAVPRNSQVEADKIALATGIAEESILAFFNTLINAGLLSNVIPTEDEIKNMCSALKKHCRHSKHTYHYLKRNLFTTKGQMVLPVNEFINY